MVTPRRSPSRSSSSRALPPSARRIAPEYRYARVVNGFSARLDPTSLRAPRCRPRGRRASIPFASPIRRRPPSRAACCPQPSRDLEIAGLDGSGVTVALLDTGVDPSHPYLRGRVLSRCRRHRSRKRRHRSAHPTIPGRPERHATELAGIIAGTEGPGGLHGIAPGASILPDSRRRLAAGRGGRLQRRTRGRIRSSRVWRLRSTRTTTATRTTPRGSPSSGWSSPMQRSRTVRWRAGSPGAADLDDAHDRPSRERRKRRPRVRSIAGPVRPRRRSRSPPQTVASPLRPFACSCAPDCACSTRPTFRSAGHRPER